MLMPDEIAQIAAAATALLAPVMPALMQLGGKAAEEAVNKLVDAGMDGVKAIWQRLYPALEKAPGGNQAAALVAANPKDADAVTMLRVQIRELLKEDPELAAEIAGILAKQKPAGASVHNTGDRAVVAGGNMHGNVIITGDHNQVS